MNEWSVKNALHKAHFTLLEVLVVLLILSMGATLTGIKLKKAYDEQCFYSECQGILNSLRTAQELMLLLDADVYVIISHTVNNQVTCSLEIEKPLNDAWAKMIERPLMLSAIESYQLGGKTEEVLKLVFSLGNMSQGSLVLTGKHANKETIYLRGYPSPIGKHPPGEEMDKIEESQRLYPAEIYEEIYSDTNSVLQ
ncbi:Uncharacterized protein PRO82_002057 [Candidatus Protochlamydia amoebophila]|uniref:prepilin-type N-terminal cleavage/methylation domain-containing protein n=1 Tax=Candidatus Protochlamydia amoebophila TaxID=362787 RepID=UPI001BC95ECF|nr:prepilin-type N-terminal cleavage/methylation domain-containing protein [Candidatus Protochlamydia amoebophila]MBS4164726.1 Uncharacterized protein [Candidatus Protochlamydia amoebophila]